MGASSIPGNDPMSDARQAALGLSITRRRFLSFALSTGMLATVAACEEGSPMVGPEPRWTAAAPATAFFDDGTGFGD